MSQLFKSPQDKSNMKKITDFLFGKPSDIESDQYLDMRTDVNTREIMNVITYYKILAENYTCESAGKLANLLERLLISTSRAGRIEAVRTMIQQFPKEDTLLRGIEESLKKSTEGIER